MNIRSPKSLARLESMIAFNTAQIQVLSIERGISGIITARDRRARLYQHLFWSGFIMLGDPRQTLANLAKL